MASNLEFSILDYGAAPVVNRPEICNTFDDESIANLTGTLRKFNAVSRGPVDGLSTAERIPGIRVSKEGREGIDSFLGKRKPAWVVAAMEGKAAPKALAAARAKKAKRK